MCEYCKDKYMNTYLLDTRNNYSTKGDFYPGIEVCIEYNKLEITAVADVYEPNCVEDSIKISYCPMCGRNLKEGEE